MIRRFWEALCRWPYRFLAAAALIALLVLVGLRARRSPVYYYRALITLCLLSLLSAGSTIVLLNTGHLSNEFYNLADA